MNPDSNFITSLFNISPESIESFVTHSSANEVVYELTLSRTYFLCPYCNGRLIGYGHKTSDASTTYWIPGQNTALHAIFRTFQEKND